MDDDTPAILGRHRLHGTPVALSPADRRRHLYVVGKTGTGKSTLLRNLLLADLAAGRGVGLLDPHGELAAAVLDHLPRRRARDLVYFRPADLAHPVGFNPLAAVPADRRHLAASHVVSAFKAIWAESWGPRLEQILANGVAALLDTPGATLLGVQRLLTDDGYRARVVARVRDPIVRAFWEREFAGYGERLRAEATAPVLNKVGRFLASPAARNVLGQPRSTFDPRFMMDHGRVLVADLGKGELGEDTAGLLGALLVAAFQLAALGRADTAEERRRDFHLCVDEFQNFATAGFAAILSEARKYRLALTLAHQYLDQLPEGLQRAVFGNVGSLVAFRVGRRDAERLAPEFGAELVPAELTELARFEAFAKLLASGDERQAVRIQTLPPTESGRRSRRETLIAQSRMRFARRRERVEARIHRWLAA